MMVIEVEEIKISGFGTFTLISVKKSGARNCQMLYALDDVQFYWANPDLANEHEYNPLRCCGFKPKPSWTLTIPGYTRTKGVPKLHCGIEDSVVLKRVRKGELRDFGEEWQS